MIRSTFIATNTQSSAALRSIERSQRALAEAQLELSSGKKSDLARELGVGIRSSVALREDHAHLSAIVHSNAVVSTRLAGADESLGRVMAEVENMLEALMASASDQTDAAQIVAQARAGLSSIEAALNTSLDGTPLFSGTNLTSPPFREYFGTSAPPSRVWTTNAFQTAFGMPATDPAVSTVPASAVTNFLDTTFAAGFAGPAWEANWSVANDSQMQARISENQVVPTTPSANAAPIRAIVRTFAMIGDLGIENMNPQARSVVINRAVRELSEASAGVTAMRSDMGRTASSVTASSQHLTATMGTIERVLSDTEDADPTELWARMNELTRDLEAAYAMVARISKLSLLERI